MNGECLSEILPWLQLLGVAAEVYVAIAAAVVTGLSVAVIAWQSWMTRRSVQLTAEALEVARAEAAVAQEGLAIARAGEARREREQVEAEQDRLDTRAAEFSLVADHVRFPADVQIDEMWADRLSGNVVMQSTFRYQNSGPAQADCSFGGVGRDLFDFACGPMEREANAEMAFSMSDRAWLDRHRSALEGPRAPLHAGCFRAVSGTDKGVVDVWYWYAFGSPLIQADEPDVHRFVQTWDEEKAAGFVSVFSPRRRIYYYSLAERSRVILEAIAPDLATRDWAKGEEERLYAQRGR